MIRESYCSFEVSKLLSLKGFDGDSSESECHMFYSEYTEGIMPITEIGLVPDYDVVCFAPTQQMAMAWLRNRGLSIEIRVKYRDDASPIYEYSWYIYRADGNKYHKTLFYEHYEDAVEAAIKYCLEEVL